MIILGIDPGTRVAGYGVVAVANRGGSPPRLVEFGEITMTGDAPLAKRLRILHEKLTAVIVRTSPEVCAVETAFAYKNIRSAMLIGHARGVALLAAAQADVAIAEYSPREIKKAVTGSGAASKEQVQYMICAMLKIARPASLDASDALAVALCHHQRSGMTGGAPAVRSWKDFIALHPDRIVGK